MKNLQIKYVHFSNQSEHLCSRKTKREREKERKARLTIRLWIISSLSEALWLTMRTKQSTWPSIYMTTTFLPCNGNFALGTYGNGGETKRAPFISPSFTLFHLSPLPSSRIPYGKFWMWINFYFLPRANFVESYIFAKCLLNTLWFSPLYSSELCTLDREYRSF